MKGWNMFYRLFRSSRPGVFLGKGVLKICSKFTEEHPFWSVTSIRLLCNFIEITLRHGCSSVSLLHIFRTPFPKNTSGQLLWVFHVCVFWYSTWFVQQCTILSDSMTEWSSSWPWIIFPWLSSSKSFVIYCLGEKSNAN